MKRLISLLLCLAMCVSLCACGGPNKNSKGCTICGKSATETFQGYKYCSRHYKDAVLWAFENVAGKN